MQMNFWTFRYYYFLTCFSFDKVSISNKSSIFLTKTYLFYQGHQWPSILVTIKNNINCLCYYYAVFFVKKEEQAHRIWKMRILRFYNFLQLLPIVSPVTRSNQYLIARWDLMESKWYHSEIIAKRILSSKIKIKS